MGLATKKVVLLKKTLPCFKGVLLNERWSKFLETTFFLIANTGFYKEKVLDIIDVLDTNIRRTLCILTRFYICLV